MNNERRSNTDAFIEKAKKIKNHEGKYEYLKVDYVTCKKKVIITCKKNGDFEQNPSEHLACKGCQKCAIKNILILENVH